MQLQYADWQLSAGIKVWQTPAIFGWPVWLQNCWRDYADKHDDQRIVLSPWQQRLVWTDIIQADIESHQNFLWNQGASVSQAIKAWQLCHDYEFEPDNWRQATGDVEVFKRWYGQYSSVLRTNDWLDQAQQINVMVANHYHPDTGSLVFADQNLAANQEKWVRHIQSLNVNEIEFLPTHKPRADAFKAEVFASFDDEIRACAHWAREQIRSNSNQTIGIVVPDLRQRAKNVLTAFRHVFTPDFDLAEDETDLFKLSTPDPIRQTGFISSALNCLELLRFKFDYQCFSQYLRDGFVHNETQRHQTFSLLDVELRKQAQPNESLPNLIRLCESSDILPTFIDQNLIERMQRLVEFRDALPKYASAASWCNAFSSALKLLGWPDIAALGAREQQLLTQWNQLLAQMCTGGLVKKQFSLNQALSQLNELANRMPVNQNQQTPIRLIDLQDISQAYFDRTWVTGLNDSVLPMKTQLNPLLPFSLQRKHRIPFCDSASCIEQSNSTYAWLTRLSADVQFSYFKNDELSDFRISPLINHLKINEAEAVVQSQFSCTQDLELQQYHDDVGLPISVESITGGTYLLKSQSACPFQAYAAYRLRAEPIQSTEPGLDAASKGILVHDVFRRIWKQLGTQQTLISLPPEKLNAVIDECINSSLQRLDLSQQLFSAIEKLRLAQLINDWLDLERQRKIAFSVVEQEYESSFRLNSINLEIKIDRIDELEDGQRMIVDYKSGNADSNQWIRDIDRPEDPQLPIYLLAENKNVSAIAFASLKKMTFDGLSDGDTGVNGVTDINKKRGKFLTQHQISDWDDLQLRWQKSVEGLAREYMQGVANVAPRNPGSQCKYCQRQALCRLYQQQDFISEDNASD